MTIKSHLPAKKVVSYADWQTSFSHCGGVPPLSNGPNLFVRVFFSTCNVSCLMRRCVVRVNTIFPKKLGLWNSETYWTVIIVPPFPPNSLAVTIGSSISSGVPGMGTVMEERVKKMLGGNLKCASQRMLERLLTFEYLINMQCCSSCEQFLYPKPHWKLIASGVCTTLVSRTPKNPQKHLNDLFLLKLICNGPRWSELVVSESGGPMHLFWWMSTMISRG